MGHVGKTVTQNVVDTADIADGSVTGADLASNIAISTSGVTALTNKLTVLASDGTADDAWVMDVRNDEATDNRSWGLRVSAGSTTTDRALDILDHAQANTLLRVDGAGHVIMPKQPCISGYHTTEAYVHPSTNTSFYTNGTFVSKHTSGITFSNDSDGKFTVPIAGTYACYFKTIIYNGYSTYAIKKNGSIMGEAYASSGTGWTIIACYTIFDMAASDYVQVINTSNHGGNYWGYGGIAHNQFSLQLIK